MVSPVSGGIMKKKKWTVVYANIPSALRPVTHGEGISIPEPLEEFTINSDDDDDEDKWTWVLLSCRHVLNHTSPMVGLLCHSHTFSHRTN
jgi:hypothetical protein